MVAEFVEDRPWVIPVVIGGGLGLIVLISRSGGGNEPTQPIPVTGQGNGEAEPGIDMILGQFLTAQGETLDAISSQTAEQIDALGQSQDSMWTAIVDMMAARDEALDEQLAAWMEDIQATQTSGNGAGDDDGDGDTSSQPTTNVPPQQGAPVGSLSWWRNLVPGAFDPRQLGGDESTNIEHPGSGIVVNHDEGWRFYKQFGTYVEHGFRTFFDAHGSHETFGAPRSQPFIDPVTGRLTQVFSRGIMTAPAGTNPETGNFPAYEDVEWSEFDPAHAA